MQTVINTIPAATILSIVNMDLSDRKPRRARQTLREWLITRPYVSLFDLNRVGRAILQLPQPDLCVTGLFIQRWESALICGQDEQLAQSVADICEELLKRIQAMNAA